MRAETTSHGWVLKRLPALGAGLLDEREETRLRAHLAGCDACRAEWDDIPLTGDDLAEAAHIPSSVLAQWKTAELEGFERDMVGAHLARCAECRHDLELLGHAPELTPVAIPGGDGARPGARSTRPGPRPRAAAAPASGGQRWVPWAIGSWAVAASVVAVTLALRMPHTEAPGAMSPLGNPSSAGRTPEAAPSDQAPTISRLSPAVRLVSPERGAEDGDIQKIALGGEETLRVVIEPLIDVDLDATIRIQLVGADGTSHAELLLPHREAVRPDRGVAFRVEPWMVRQTGPLTFIASAHRSPQAPIPGIESASYKFRLVPPAR
jgi:hypothetical protein